VPIEKIDYVPDIPDELRICSRRFVDRPTLPIISSNVLCRRGSPAFPPDCAGEGGFTWTTVDSWGLRVTEREDSV
jgi:hypothetical protein